MSSYPTLRPPPQCELLAVAKSFTQEPERVAERDLTCGISSITLAVSGNEVEIEYGSAVFSSGLRTGYDEAVRLKVEFLRPRKLNRCYCLILAAHRSNFSDVLTNI